jgi:Xaa-Pro aminopeptidase
MPSLLLYSDTERSPAMRHEVPIPIIDTFLFAEFAGRTIVLTSWLEADRIAEVLPHAELFDFFELGLHELVGEGHARESAAREVIVRLLHQIGLREATVPGDFPLAVADRLRKAGVDLTVDDDYVDARRRAKAGPELEGIRRAQRAAEAGMAAAARTFVVGAPLAEHAALIARLERLVSEAMERVVAATRPGVTGRALFDLTCDVF